MPMGFYSLQPPRPRNFILRPLSGLMFDPSPHFGANTSGMRPIMGMSAQVALFHHHGGKVENLVD